MFNCYILNIQDHMYRICFHSTVFNRFLSTALVCLYCTFSSQFWFHCLKDHIYHIKSALRGGQNNRDFLCCIYPSQTETLLLCIFLPTEGVDNSCVICTCFVWALEKSDTYFYNIQKPSSFTYQPCP